MPPSPSWYEGPAAVFPELRQDGSVIAVGVHVLDIAADGIGSITAFMDPAIAARFAP
jgi:arginyl-tRNA--protein-N-Asp/Glu arginylyltransferase